MAPPRRSSGGGGAAAAAADPRRAALAWLNSYSKCSSWFAQYADIDARLEAGGGICRSQNFLPDHVAEGALAILEALPPRRWNDTAAEEVRGGRAEGQLPAGVCCLSAGGVAAPPPRQAVHSPCMQPLPIAPSGP